MRVISGSARGRKLKQASDSITRPTASVVKEAVFNILQTKVVGGKILDLFAGTGQMGIEFISRGAEHCVFVDSDRNAVSAIKENLKNTNFTQQSDVYQMSVQAFIQKTTQKFDIIFLDPPYDQSSIPKILPELISCLEQGGVVVCEAAKTDELPDMIHDFGKSKDYIYGARKLNLYKRLSK